MMRMPMVVVGTAVKERLDQLQAQMTEDRGRKVTLGEVIEVLVAEHDAREEGGSSCSSRTSR